MTTNRAKKPAVDQVVLNRPKGVYTGGEGRKRRKSEVTSGGTLREFGIKKRERSKSFAQAFSHGGKIRTEVKDWQPEPLSDGTYGSSEMQELCDEFAKLASEIVQGFEGGK